MKKINYEKELNPAQLEAVKSTDGPYIVIAGAGSGKTRTLVYRVAYLVEKGVKPDEILLLTFTRKAAEEMLRRASIILDERCSRVSGGTFHSFANFTLRRYARLLGISPNFTILDEADAEDAINFIRAKLGLNKKEKRFPRKGTLRDVISSAVNKAQTIDKVLYDEYPQFIEWSKEIEQIRKEYSQYKYSKSLLDYDDLLVFLKNLLVEHEDVRQNLSRKYKYIMVDEYQDTNKIQAYITSLLASEHKNIMVVGDDSQSIYSFRGADFRNIMDFPQLFKGAKIITLEENYRSTQPILDMTNEVIKYAEEKYPKNLFTRKKSGELPIFIDAENENAQSKYIADKILELREDGIELKDIAVLFRSGWHSHDLEIELANRNIPFAKYGGQKFVEAAHIKDVMAYLRIVYNIFDQVSWYRALLLMRGIGTKTADSLVSEIITNKKGLVLDEKFLNKTEDFKKLIQILNGIDAKQNKPAEMINVFLKYYQPLLQEKYDDFNKRLNDLDSLVRIAARYSSLEEFLSDMALDPPERNIIGPGSKDKDDSRLVLSTIHSAKGLEWHTVFLIYVAEGHLPSYLSLEDEAAIEEECRLFYVAVTRAKENLFLLKPNIDRSGRSYFNDSATVFTRVSRFLEQGDILNKFFNTEGANIGISQEISFDETIAEKPAADREFLHMLRDYFRYEDY